MKIERFEVPGLAQYAYIVSDAGDAVIIDPVRDVDRYLAYLRAKDLRLTHVLETHIHADFASGSIALAQATGAELAFSAYDEAERFVYAMPHRRLRDGDALRIGKLRLETLHTPGHTPEHISFVLYEELRSTDIPVALFSGDFLFVGSLGRPDLLGDDAKLGLAHELYRSVRERIVALPDSVLVYPGHGAGSLCGAGLSERMESTLGFERATNPFFRYDEDEFVEKILASAPEMPTYYPRMKQLNADGAPSVDPLPGSRELAAEDVRALAADAKVLLLDVRRPEAFGGAHIAGAVNIGAGQNLSLWAGWLLDPSQPIVLIGENGEALDDVQRSLVRVGLDRIEGRLKGGMAEWIAAGLPVARTEQLSAAEVHALAGQVAVLDVRSDREWQQGAIPGAVHVRLGDLMQSLDRLGRPQKLVVVCGSGYRSSIAASLLEHSGRTGLCSMAGGMAAWQRQSLPIAA